MGEEEGWLVANRLEERKCLPRHQHDRTNRSELMATFASLKSVFGAFTKCQSVSSLKSCCDQAAIGGISRRRRDSTAHKESAGSACRTEHADIQHSERSRNASLAIRSSRYTKLRQELESRFTFAVVCAQMLGNS